jgi:hypothetical protein
MQKIVAVKFKTEAFIFNDHYDVGDIKMFKENEARTLEDLGKVKIIDFVRDAVVINPEGDLKRYEKVIINSIRGEKAYVEDYAGDDHVVSVDNLRTVEI